MDSSEELKDAVGSSLDLQVGLSVCLVQSIQGLVVDSAQNLAMTTLDPVSGFNQRVCDSLDDSRHLIVDLLQDIVRMEEPDVQEGVQRAQEAANFRFNDIDGGCQPIGQLSQLGLSIRKGLASDLQQGILHIQQEVTEEIE